MGVKGLWQLVLPIGRRIDIETLEGQILAVDASIWMTQFLKAMKDPDSGSVRPAAHIIGFFRRICKLRFHGIRPVFVFDGATPEIKRIELSQRRRRRDQFVAQHGQAAVQRMAKRLLVEQLRKSKAKIMVNNNNDSNNSNKGVTIQLGNNNNQIQDDGGGAFAPGFDLPESERVKNSNDEKNNDNTTFQIKNGEILITTTGTHTNTEENHSEYQDDSGMLNDNDWDRPIEVDDDNNNHTDNEGNDKSSDDEVEYDDVLWSSGRTKRQRKQQKRSAKKKKKGDFFDEEYILSLPPTERKDAIEEAKRKQRMLSRKEFLPVAANAVDYSQTQLRNFLRSSKLNQDIVKMAKKAVHQESKDKGGELMASDRTRRIIFEKDTDKDKQGNKKNKSQRSIYSSRGDDSSSSSGDWSAGDDDDDNGSDSEEEEETGDGGFLRRSDERPTNALRQRSKQQPTATSAEVVEVSPSKRHRLRKVGHTGASDDESGGDGSEDEEGGGGFFASSDKGTNADRPVGTKKRKAIDDEEDDSDDSQEGGGFIVEGENTKVPAEEAGGFMTSVEKHSSSSSSSNGNIRTNENSRKKTDNKNCIDDPFALNEGGFMSGVAERTTKSHGDGVSMGGGFLMAEVPPRRNNAGQKKVHFQNIHDERKKVHFQDIDDEVFDGGDESYTPSPAKNNVPKGARRLQLSAGAASAMAGSFFRSDNTFGGDDSSDEGGGFLRGRPVTNEARFKTTGEEDEVIVLDDAGGNKGRTKNANTAQEFHDQMLAKALQEEEDADYAARMAASDVVEIDDQSEEDEVVEEVIVAHRSRSHGFRPTSKNTVSEQKQIAGAGPKQPPPSPKATSMMAIDADESDEDEVDWENGSDVEDNKMEADGDGQQALSGTESLTEKAALESSAVESAGMKEQETASHESSIRPAAKCSMMSDEADDSENDDIAWESGAGKVDANRKKAPSPTKTNIETCTGEDNELAADVNGSDNEDVQWEDGKHDDNGEKTVWQQRSEQAMSGKQHTSDDEDEAADFDDDEMDFHKPDMEMDQGGGDFVSPREVNNAAAWQQAEATASNLTNWAGRAVRRAIAEHLGGANPEKTGKPAERVVDSPETTDPNVAEDTIDSISANEKMLEFNEDNAEEAAKMLNDYETEIADASKNNMEGDTAPTDEMREEIMQLLQLFGVPYVQAPAEAEAQCVALEKLGLVSGVVTEDSDVFVFGAKTVYKNIFDEGKYVETYRTDDAEKQLGLGNNAMVALAMLLGGDYTEGVKGVGVVNGMEVVRDFDVADDLKGGLQKFRAWLDGFEPVIDAMAKKDKGKALTKEQRFHIDHRTARNKWIAPENFPSDAVITAYTKPVVDNSTTRFSFGVPDMEGILAFLTKHAGWVPEETRRVLAPVVERVEGKKSYQPRIDQYMTYDRGIKFADVRSKRLRRVFASVQNDGGDEGEDGAIEARESSAPSKAKRRKRRSRVGGAPAKDQNSFELLDATKTTLDQEHLQGSSTHDSGSAARPAEHPADNNISRIGEASTGLVGIAKVQIPKTKPKSLKTYLGQAKSTDEKMTAMEQTEAVRVQKRNLPARAPPAYSETSNLAKEVDTSSDPKTTAEEGASSESDPAARPSFPSVTLD